MVRVFRKNNESSLGDMFGAGGGGGGARGGRDYLLSSPDDHSELVRQQQSNRHRLTQTTSNQSTSTLSYNFLRASRASPTFKSSSPTFHHQCHCLQCELQQKEEEEKELGEEEDDDDEDGLFGGRPLVPNKVGKRTRKRPSNLGDSIIILPAAAADSLPQIGLCQSCRKVYGTGGQRAVDYDDILSQKRREENSYRNGDPFVGNMKGSSSEGYLNSKYDDSFNLGNDLSELTGTLARLEHASKGGDDSANGTMDYDNMSYNPGGRLAFSAPNEADGGSGSYGGHTTRQQQPPPAGRRGAQQNPTSRSAYRRELQAQADEQAARREREKAEMRAERHNNGGGDSRDRRDGLHFDDHANRPRDGRRGRGNGGAGGVAGGYQPSVYDGGGGGGGGGGSGRRGRGDDDGRDWWEKRDQRRDPSFSPTKPHPSLSYAEHPRSDKATLDEELKRQMEEKQRYNEERRRREQEEEAKLDRRIREQQEKMKAEYEQEQEKKRAKEEAKVRRQEEMVRKQQELQKEVEKQRKEAAELKRRGRGGGRGSNRNGLGENEEDDRRSSRRERSPTPPTPEREERRGPLRGEEIRPDSPPIPSMKGKVPTIRQRSQNNNQSSSSSSDRGSSSNGGVVDRLSNMREQLERKEEEHGDVWNGLVEV